MRGLVCAGGFELLIESIANRGLPEILADFKALLSFEASKGKPGYADAARLRELSSDFSAMCGRFVQHTEKLLVTTYLVNQSVQQVVECDVQLKQGCLILFRAVLAKVRSILCVNLKLTLANLAAPSVEAPYVCCFAGALEQAVVRIERVLSLLMITYPSHELLTEADIEAFS